MSNEITAPQDLPFAPDRLTRKKTAEFLEAVGNKYNELSEIEAANREYHMAARHKELADAYLTVAEKMNQTRNDLT